MSHDTDHDQHLHLHLHLDDLEKLLGFTQQLSTLTRKVDNTMATVQDVKDAIQKEADEVATRVTDLETQLSALQSAGTGATPEQLDEIVTAVQGIFTPKAATA